LARFEPNRRGTYEARAESLLGEALEKLGKREEAARARLKLPAGYKRPALKDALTGAPGPVQLGG
jgi:hypothetical protein